MINPTHIRIFYFDDTINLNSLLETSGESVTDIPAKIKDKYYQNKIFTDVGLIGITNELYTIVDNCIPNKIRKSTLHNIKGTESSIIDLNLVSDQNLYDYKEAINDDLVSSIRYSVYEDSKLINRHAYSRFFDGHIEIIINVDQSPVVSDKSKRPVLIVIEELVESNYNFIISSCDTHVIDTGLKLENNSAMISSSCKIIRFIIQLGDNESIDSAKVRQYYNIFNDIDLGILEILTKFDKSIDQKINSVEASNIISQYGMTDKLGVIKSTDGNILTLQDEIEL